MKNSKRILGVVLALIMIFNVFAVGTFAAFPDDAAVKLMVKTDKATYVQGETITLTFSEQCIDEIGQMQIGGQYEIAYQDDVLDFISTDYKIQSHNFNAIQSGSVAGSSVVQMPASSSGPSANDYGWDTTTCWCVVDDLSTTFVATEAVDLFTVEMKIADDAPDGTYTIGFNPAGYEEYNAYSNDGIGYCGLYGVSASEYGFSVPNMYEYGTCTFTVGAAEEDDIVYHVKDQIQWADKAANTVNLGVVAGFDVEDIAIAFDGNGTSTNVSAVGATVAINGETSTKTERYVYSANDGASYYFRTVITGVPADYEGDIVVTPFVTVDGETTYGDAVTIAAADLAALVAKLPA